MELTVASLIGELGLELACGEQSAHARVRWVHSTELPDPTPWLKGGELLQRAMVGDVLSEVLTGHLYPEDLQARLRPFGIGDQVAVLAFKAPDPSSAAAVLEGILKREHVASLVAVRAGLLCAVIDPGAANGPAAGDRAGSGAAADGAPESPPPLALARKIRTELSGRFGSVPASASRAMATHSLRIAFHEARCALEAVRLRNGGAPEVASYADLGAFQLLLALQDDEALGSYCRSVLDPIERDEGEYGEELVRSLDVFIEHNGHWEKAANALFCHRHTLRYRIRRVEALTGRDFSSARDRIEFWLALRGRELAR
ncbi:MAG: helix-turn-helix domain-containing protein [Solirubrobacteraceae bacterium]